MGVRKSHVYRGTPCIPGVDPAVCPGCHLTDVGDGEVRFGDGGRLEVFDGTAWIPLQRLPDPPIGT
jgi:hypothetical protein